MMEQLRQRFRRIVGNDADITLVFDRGNNSEDNLDLIEGEGLVIIESLRIGGHLLAPRDL